jgi:lipoprotein NlpI
MRASSGVAASRSWRYGRCATRGRETRARATTQGDTGRRGFVRQSVGVGLSMAMAVLAAPLGADAGVEYTRRGMSRFSQNDVEGSMEDFDRVIANDARYASYMWQRGISAYYLEAFDVGAAQFRDDVRVNANDTEEAVWAFLCEARDDAKGFEYARKNMLVTGKDSRLVMSSVYGLFAGQNDEGALREAGKRSASDEFYSALYLGLWYEVNGDAARAKQEILRANNTAYGKLSGDYMADVAKVHAKRRGWIV